MKAESQTKVVLISNELHRDVKAKAAKNGISLRTAVSVALRAWLDRGVSETAA